MHIIYESGSHDKELPYERPVNTEVPEEEEQEPMINKLQKALVKTSDKILFVQEDPLNKRLEIFIPAKISREELARLAIDINPSIVEYGFADYLVTFKRQK